MNDLLENINKIHTTDLGILRIKRNLGIEIINAVNWCKKKIKKADKIIKNGKNWNVYVWDIIITINAKSYTIITAHKINNGVRVVLRITGLYAQTACSAVWVPFG